MADQGIDEGKQAVYPVSGRSPRAGDKLEIFSLLFKHVLEHREIYPVPMSVLTGRYTSSPETAFDVDIRNITEQNAQDYLDAVEQAELSDAFWNAGLPQQMDTSVASSPYFNVFLASQVKANDKGFISSDHTVQTLLEGASHVHHVFPRNYLEEPWFAAQPLQPDRELRRDAGRDQHCHRRQSSGSVFQRALAAMRERRAPIWRHHRRGRPAREFPGSLHTPGHGFR